MKLNIFWKQQIKKGVYMKDKIEGMIGAGLFGLVISLIFIIGG